MLLGCAIVRRITSSTCDANGNSFSFEEPSGDVTTNTWNGENRLVEVEHPGGDITTYTYNADGLRVREEHDGVETRFVYDGNNLLREADDTNLPEADYTYIPQAYAEAISQRRDGDSSFSLVEGIRNVRRVPLLACPAVEFDSQQKGGRKGRPFVLPLRRRPMDQEHGRSPQAGMYHPPQIGSARNCTSNSAAGQASIGTRRMGCQYRRRLLTSAIVAYTMIREVSP